MARIDGNDDDNILDGTPEADTVQGFGGDDIITTFSGDDVINAGFGSNIINPGNGEDKIEIVPHEGTDTIKGFSYDGDLLVLNGFSNISGYVDLADFISARVGSDDPYTIIDLGAANDGPYGVQVLRLSPVGVPTELDVVFDTPVIQQEAEVIPFDPDPDPVLTADPNIPPPPIDLFG